MILPRIRREESLSHGYQYRILRNDPLGQLSR